MDVWKIVTAVSGAAAAIVAAVAAWQSRSAAQKASKAAQALARIEEDRRHDELTPVFEVTGEPGDSAMLKITLAGGTDALDEVVVAIQDESGTDHWGRGLPDGVTQEQAEAFVWGPWEFGTNASAQVVSNRQTRPRPHSLLSGKNWDVLALAATRRGSWMTGITPGKWTKDRRQQPIRLLISCRREGHRPWFVPLEVQPRYPKPPRRSFFADSDRRRACGSPDSPRATLTR